MGDATWFEAYRPPHQEEIVWRAEAVVARRFRERLTLGEIAAEVGASPFHLCRLFTQQRDFSLHAYQVQLRLRTALEYVVDTRKDLTELSFEVGFSSHSHFTSAFKRQFGVTPSALRTQCPSVLQIKK